MSPDSVEATRQRKAWRLIAGLGCILGATGILLAAILSAKTQHNTDQVDAQGQRGRQAICAIIKYSEDTLQSLRDYPRPPKGRQKAAEDRFKKLVYDMRATGIYCPPPPRK